MKLTATYEDARPHLLDDLRETRRRLDPYTALQGSEDPFRLCDAEIARSLAEVIDTLEAVIRAMPPFPGRELS
jgi:hypothetical protein